MPYSRNPVWANGEIGDTPITAAKLNNLEAGVENASATAEAALNRLDSGIGSGGSGGGGGWVVGANVDPSLYPDGTAIAELSPGVFN